MTRNEYNSVAISIDPLRDDLALPIRDTDMLKNIVLLIGDSIRSTQESLNTDAIFLARSYTSPLVTPEITTGVITNGFG
ncbi:MAG: hypothetical protein RRY29_05530 [Desulfovibrionaceae bacterium]